MSDKRTVELKAELACAFEAYRKWRFSPEYDGKKAGKNREMEAEIRRRISQPRRVSREFMIHWSLELEKRRKKRGYSAIMPTLTMVLREAGVEVEDGKE